MSATVRRTVRTRAERGFVRIFEPSVGWDSESRCDREVGWQFARATVSAIGPDRSGERHFLTGYGGDDPDTRQHAELESATGGRDRAGRGRSRFSPLAAGMCGYQ